MPILLILFGALFLLGNLGVVTGDTVSVSWPVLVIIAGLMKLKGGSCACYMRAS